VATPLGVRRGLSVAFLCESYISIFWLFWIIH
jgi:hypothetical protein